MEEVWEARLVDMQLPVSATSSLLRSVVVTLPYIDVLTRRTISAVHVRCNTMHLTFAPVLITDTLEVSDMGSTQFDKTRTKSVESQPRRFGRTCHLHFQARDVG
jgi:hypothetical protein